MGHSIELQLAKWQDFYSRHFGEQHDFSGVRIPAQQLGFNQLILVPTGMTPYRAIVRCQELFAVYYVVYGLEQNGGHGQYTHSRTANQSYALWLEGKFQHIGSTKDAFEAAVTRHHSDSLTMLERLLLELKYFDENPGHHPNPVKSLERYELCFGSQQVQGDEGVQRHYVFQIAWDTRAVGAPRRGISHEPGLRMHDYCFGFAPQISTKFRRVVA